MLFVVLICRNKIIRVWPRFYFYSRLVYGECSISSLRISYLVYFILSILKMDYLGPRAHGQLHLLGFFFLHYSELIYLFVCSSGYISALNVPPPRRCWSPPRSAWSLVVRPVEVTESLDVTPGNPCDSGPWSPPGIRWTRERLPSKRTERPFPRLLTTCPPRPPAQG